jgi:hypothetical protein
VGGSSRASNRAMVWVGHLSVHGPIDWDALQAEQKKRNFWALHTGKRIAGPPDEPSADVPGCHECGELNLRLGMRLVPILPELKVLEFCSDTCLLTYLTKRVKEREPVPAKPEEVDIGLTITRAKNEDKPEITTKKSGIQMPEMDMPEYPGPWPEALEP